jgi:hypothetical protein
MRLLCRPRGSRILVSEEGKGKCKGGRLRLVEGMHGPEVTVEGNRVLVLALGLSLGMGG